MGTREEKNEKWNFFRSFHRIMKNITFPSSVATALNSTLYHILVHNCVQASSEPFMKEMKISLVCLNTQSIIRCQQDILLIHIAWTPSTFSISMKLRNYILLKRCRLTDYSEEYTFKLIIYIHMFLKIKISSHYAYWIWFVLRQRTKFVNVSKSDILVTYGWNSLRTWEKKEVVLNRNLCSFRKQL